MTIHAVAYQIYGGQTVELEEHDDGRFRLLMNGVEQHQYDAYGPAWAAFSAACEETAWGQLSIFRKEVP